MSGGHQIKKGGVTQHDPFTAGGTGANSGTGGRIAGAEWFAEICEQLDITADSHLRRVHYKLVSQDPPVQILDGENYINTEQCETVLERTSLDARYLKLVAQLVDRRNPEPVINLDDAEADDGVITANTFNEEGGLKSYSVSVPPIERPRLRILSPTIPQRYHVEIWFEKSTMNDILMPLAERYGINVCTALGEFSYTRCTQLIDRARASGKPVRILYGSDFDSGGQIMPVSMARKLEFLIRTEAPDLDVQVRCVVLTASNARNITCRAVRPRRPTSARPDGRNATAKALLSWTRSKPCTPACSKKSWWKRSSATTTAISMTAETRSPTRYKTIWIASRRLSTGSTPRRWQRSTPNARPTQPLSRRSRKRSPGR
jgi:hypothetical protein